MQNNSLFNEFYLKIWIVHVKNEVFNKKNIHLTDYIW